MKYATLNGEKIEAAKDAKGICPSCGAELIPKCGNVNIHHWSHKGERNCDPWWENETDWHRAWKNKFPKEWQEVLHFDENGEKHIADVKTASDWVLEFQHSYLRPEERQARNTFYKKVVWVIDGTRRKTDIPRFQNLMSESEIIYGKPLIRRIRIPDEYRLIREWHDTYAWTLLDFQDEKETNLWFLLPKISENNIAYLLSCPRQEFINLHINSQFDDVVKIVKMLMSSFEQLSRMKSNITYQNKLVRLDPLAVKRRRFRPL